MQASISFRHSGIGNSLLSGDGAPRRLNVLRAPVRIAVISLVTALVCCLGSESSGACIDYGDYLHLAGSVNTPGSAHHVAVSGTHAYVADWGSGLQVIDITNAQSPQIVGGVDTPGTAHEVVVSGTYAYVADGFAGLKVIDITNPQSPQIVGSVNTPGLASGVAVSGTTPTSRTRFRAASDRHHESAKPPDCGKRGHAGQPGVAVSGTYAYVADGAAGLQVIDITNPQSPEMVGGVVPGALGSVAVSGTYAYATNYSYGLHVIDITNPRKTRDCGSRGRRACPGRGGLGHARLRREPRLRTASDRHRESAES